MNHNRFPDPFRQPLQARQQLLESFSGEGIIIGGIAASLLGEPRATADIDAVVLATFGDLDELITLAERVGIFPRITVAVDFAKQSRVLLLSHQESGIDIDISLGLLPFEVEAVERAQRFEADGLSLRLPTPEDLIIQKAVAHRAKDMGDIEGVIAANPTLDWARIQFWVEQFPDILEMPELWLDIKKLRDLPH